MLKLCWSGFLSMTIIQLYLNALFSQQMAVQQSQHGGAATVWCFIVHMDQKPVQNVDVICMSLRIKVNQKDSTHKEIFIC